MTLQETVAIITLLEPSRLQPTRPTSSGSPKPPASAGG